MHERFRYKNKEELLARAAGLGLDLPFSDDITPLLEPASVGGSAISNRLVVQPMEGYDSLPEGSPSELTSRRYMRYAAGGSGILWYEAVAVSPSGRSNPNQLWINRGNMGVFRDLNEKVKSTASSHGVKPMLVIQLTHSGRYSKPEKTPRPEVAAPNAILDKTPPHVLSDRELQEIQDQYILAAKLAVEAGFDAIDLKACHGYLMVELLGAKNRSGSIYGGEPAASRFRFMLETLERMQCEVPGTILTTRLNMSDLYQGGFGIDEKSDVDYTDSLLLAEELKNRGIALINLSMGSPYFNPHVTRPYDTPVPGQKLPEEHPMEGVMKMIRGTALFQQKFPEISFVGSAYSWLRQFAPNVGAAVLKKGYASFIGFGRNSFAYPDLPLDLKNMKCADPSKVCITCSGCTRLIRSFRPAGCVIRDKEIYAAELKKLIADESDTRR